jgi:L-lysine exporter family protein LysE/ArgO
MQTILPVALSGFLLMSSLVVAVGPENAFILRQGLTGRHVGLVVSSAIVIDLLLIALGCLGLGALVSGEKLVLTAISWGGALFLVYYAVGAFRRALHPHGLGPLSESSVSVGEALRILLAVTILNPNVLMDTVLLVGGTSARYAAEERIWYFLGAGLASTLWFLLIGCGARYLRGFFASECVWRCFECVNGAIMLWAATRIALPA